MTRQIIDQHGNELDQITLSKIEKNFKELYDGLGLTAGATASSGTFLANGATGVAVADTGVTAGSIIIYSLKTVGGTVGIPTTLTITPGTGFHAVSQASDTSTYNWRRLG